MTKEWLETLVEPLARLMAAETMNLIKDPCGENIPHDLWIQKNNAAREFLGLPLKGNNQ